MTLYLEGFALTDQYPVHFDTDSTLRPPSIMIRNDHVIHCPIQPEIKGPQKKGADLAVPPAVPP